MNRILVFNNDSNRMETFFRNDNDRMPYNAGGTLTVREFRARSTSRTLWTEKRAMQAWNSFRNIWRRTNRCAVRHLEGHGKAGTQPNHNITHGVAFDVRSENDCSPTK